MNLVSHYFFLGDKMLMHIGTYMVWGDTGLIWFDH